MAERRLISALRRRIYNRWFYAFLAFVCLLNVATEILDIVDPGENFLTDTLAIILSGLAAFLTMIVFIDLHFRRTKL